MFTLPENTFPFSQINSHYCYTHLLLSDGGSVAVVIIYTLHTCMQFLELDNVKNIL